MTKTTISIPTRPYGLEEVLRETEADIYGVYAVHPTFWGPPHEPVKGKPGWLNWSVTGVKGGLLIGAFRYQRTAKAFAQAMMQPSGLALDEQGVIALVRKFQDTEGGNPFEDVHPARKLIGYAPSHAGLREVYEGDI